MDTPLEKEMKKSYDRYIQSKKAMAELETFGKPTKGIVKGTVWTVGDIAHYMKSKRRK